MKYKISYRDMEIYSAFILQDQTKKEIADYYGISITRVSQIIHKVGYLLAEYPDLKVGD